MRTFNFMHKQLTPSTHNVALGLRGLERKFLKICTITLTYLDSMRLLNGVVNELEIWLFIGGVIIDSRTALGFPFLFANSQMMQNNTTAIITEVKKMYSIDHSKHVILQFVTKLQTHDRSWWSHIISESLNWDLSPIKLGVFQIKSLLSCLKYFKFFCEVLEMTELDFFTRIFEWVHKIKTVKIISSLYFRAFKRKCCARAIFKSSQIWWKSNVERSRTYSEIVSLLRFFPTLTC